MARDPGAGGPDRRLGPFLLGRRLGKGATGTVFEGELLEDRPYGAAGLRVAVKIPSREWLDQSGGAERYSREARITASIRHPCIVRVHELGEDQEGRPFLVQELVQGRSLRHLIRAHGPLPEPFLRSLARRVADGLLALHEAGAIHGDIKPDNLGITPDHEIKLLDFGLARSREDTAAPDQRHPFAGSPVYAAPEQFEGSRAGPSSDLYSLGITLYECACGSPPFLGESFEDLMAAHLEREPLPLTERHANVSSWFAWVVGGLLAKHPRDRPGSATQLLEILTDGEDSPRWRTVGAKRRGTLPVRLRGRDEDALLVGREDESSRLEALVEGARVRQGGAILLMGAAGMGKTCLVEAVGRQAARCGDPLRIAWGGSRDHAPSGPVGEALCGLLGEPLEEALAHRLPGREALAPGLAAFLRGEAAPPGAEGLALATAADLAAGIARAEAAAAPVLWILEDLHEEGALAHRLFLDLAKEAADLSSAVVGTARPLPARHPLVSGEVDLLHLKALSEGGSRMLARQVAGAALSEETLSRIIEKSSGVPLFLVELARHARWQSLQADLDSEGVAATRRRAATVQVPPNLREAVLRRLEILDATTVAALEAAAVQGSAFDPELLARVLGRPVLEVHDLAMRLEKDLDLLRSEEGRFLFRHRLLADAIRDSLSDSRRRRLHRQTAEALLAREGGPQVAPDELEGESVRRVARHLVEAEAPERARPFLVPAARHLESGHGSSEALIAFVDACLEAMPDLEAGTASELLGCKAVALHRLGRREAERDCIRRALDLAEIHGDPGRIGRARYALAEWLLRARSAGEAGAVLEAALPDAVRSGDRALECDIRGGLGIVAIQQGRFEEARAHLEAERRVARVGGNAAAEAHAVTYLATVALDSGRLEEALKLGREAVALRRDLGLVVGEAIALGNLGHIHAKRGEIREALELQGRALDLYRRVGYRHAEAAGCSVMGGLHQWEGRLAEARRWFEQAVAIAREQGDRTTETACRCSLGQIALLEGNLGKAESLLGGALREADALGSGRIVHRARLALADMAFSREDLEGALEQCGQLEAAAQVEQEEAELAFHNGRALLAAGDPTGVRRLRHAAELVEKRSLVHLGPLPTAWLALAGEEDPQDIEVDARSPVAVRAEAHAVLHRAGGGEEHRAVARRLLEGLAEHLEAAGRERFWTHQPVARLLAKEEPGDG